MHIKGLQVRISKLKCTSVPVFILAFHADLYETVPLVVLCTQMVNIDKLTWKTLVCAQLDLLLITPEGLVEIGTEFSQSCAHIQLDRHTAL